jgi:hypothetical protein
MLPLKPFTETIPGRVATLRLSFLFGFLLSSLVKLLLFVLVCFSVVPVVLA